MIRSFKFILNTKPNHLIRHFSFDPNTISRFSLEYPDELVPQLLMSQNKKPRVDVISLPMDPCLLENKQINDIMSEIEGKKVLVSVDPTNYLYNRRRYDYNFKKKTENIDDFKYNDDPIHPFNVQETTLNFPVLDYFYRSNMAIDSPLEFKEAERQFLEKYQKNEAGDISSAKNLIDKNAYVLSDVFDNAIRVLQNSTDKKSEEHKKCTKQYNEIWSLMQQLLVWNNQFTTDDIKHITINASLFSKADTVYFCGIPELLMRMIYASNYSSKSMLNNFIEELQEHYDFMLNEQHEFDKG